VAAELVGFVVDKIQLAVVTLDRHFGISDVSNMATTFNLGAFW